MKLNIDLSAMNRLLDIMGAKRRDWSPSPSRFERERAERVKELETSGIEIERHDLIVDENGFLQDESGEQIVIYIKDNTIHGRKNPLSNPYRRLHLSDCETIDEKKSDGTYDRFVATRRTDGFFPIDLKDQENVEVKLWPCQRCLDLLNYKGFSFTRDHRIVTEFDIVEFFKSNEPYFEDRPKYDAETAPSSGYAPAHSKIARQTKERRNWTCEKCRVYFGEYKNRKYLHLHHKNGVKGDNRPSNLQVLCYECHADIHPHMRYPS